MLSYDKSLKQLSRNLRRNMTDAKRLLRSKIRGKQFIGAVLEEIRIFDFSKEGKREGEN